MLLVALPSRVPPKASAVPDPAPTVAPTRAVVLAKAVSACFTSNRREAMPNGTERTKPTVVWASRSRLAPLASTAATVAGVSPIAWSRSARCWIRISNCASLVPSKCGLKISRNWSAIGIQWGMSMPRPVCPGSAVCGGEPPGGEFDSMDPIDCARMEAAAENHWLTSLLLRSDWPLSSALGDAGDVGEWWDAISIADSCALAGCRWRAGPIPSATIAKTGSARRTAPPRARGRMACAPGPEWSRWLLADASGRTRRRWRGQGRFAA
uniref:Uncharacterized protein n=1 Tax=Ralstonia solanacearum TaxID=305 RepID=A0A0S4X182_RALSL|nr:protein of unknown function [Ralstonia solanacearum]